MRPYNKFNYPVLSIIIFIVALIMRVHCDVRPDEFYDFAKKNDCIWFFRLMDTVFVPGIGSSKGYLREGVGLFLSVILLSPIIEMVLGPIALILSYAIVTRTMLFSMRESLNPGCDSKECCTKIENTMGFRDCCNGEVNTLLIAQFFTVLLCCGQTNIVSLIGLIGVVLTWTFFYLSDTKGFGLGAEMSIPDAVVNHSYWVLESIFFTSLYIYSAFVVKGTKFPQRAALGLTLLSFAGIMTSLSFGFTDEYCKTV